MGPEAGREVEGGGVTHEQKVERAARRILARCPSACRNVYAARSPIEGARVLAHIALTDDAGRYGRDPLATTERNAHD